MWDNLKWKSANCQLTGSLTVLQKNQNFYQYCFMTLTCILCSPTVHPLNFYRSVFWKMKGSKHCSFTFNQIFTSIDISSCRKPNFCWQLTISQNFSKRGNFLIKWPTMSQHCGSRFRENLNFVCVQGRDVMHLCSIHSIEK